MTKDEALDLVLETLERMNHAGSIFAGEFDKELAAIKQALAAQPAPVQEPVAKKTGIGLVTSNGWDSLPVGTLFYTTPPAEQRQWVGLTEQEAAECWSTSTVRTWQAIEAKLKEKNT